MALTLSSHAKTKRAIASEHKIPWPNCLQLCHINFNSTRLMDQDASFFPYVDLDIFLWAQMKPCHGSAMCFKCGCHVSQILTPEVAVLKGWHCPCAIDSPSHPISHHCTPGVHLQCWWSIWLCTPVCHSSPSTDVTPLIESLPWFQPKNQNSKYCMWQCNDDAIVCDVVWMKLIWLLI